MSGEVGAEFSAVVTDIQMESRDGATTRWRMALSRTVFAAGDVGVLHAVSRGGTRIQVPVLAVVACGGEAAGRWHRCGGSSHPLSGDYCAAERLIWSGALDVVDDEDGDWAFGGYEFKAELLLNRCEDVGRSVGRR